MIFQPISYGVVILVYRLISLAPETHCLGLERLSLDNKCGKSKYGVSMHWLARVALYCKQRRMEGGQGVHAPSEIATLEISSLNSM